jgi:hypothetical protein
VARVLALLAGRQYLLAAALALLAFAPFVFAVLRRPGRALASLAGAAMLVLLAVVACLPPLNAERSTRALALHLKPRLHPDDQVVSYRLYFQDLPVYLERKVIIAGWTGELEMGTKAEDTTAWIIDLDAFDRLWRGPRTVYVVADAKRLATLAASGLPVRVLARSGRNVLVVNR